MEIKLLSADVRESWNSFVAGWPDFGLLQTYEWGAFKENLGWKAIRLGVQQDTRLVAGAQVLVKRLPLKLGSIAYVPRGPLVDWQDQTLVRTLLAAIHDVATQHRAIFLKIEPALLQTPDAVDLLKSHGFRRSRNSNQPPCTLIIDLTPDVETILANMRKSTRHNIRRSQRQGVSIREGEKSDLPTFFRLLQHTAKRAGFPVRSFDYYREEWETLSRAGRVKLLLAMYQDDVLAVSMEAAFGGKAASLHSGSFETYHHLKPNDLLIWEYLKWAKAQGCKSYDLWGIPDEVGELVTAGQPIPEDRQEGLWGVYHFKRGFGGQIVYYTGAYDYVYVKPVYAWATTIMSWLDSTGALTRFVDRT